ncbi:Asp23/Gls24 family envelope stress response protein [Streptomyces sp. NPDC020917]|uniref:Asp23/Gls24 family envelope stress response protein n=1 Tax=Streptomyces sp. NPDC020917 TaxID=3365102 RepID=UPI003798E607
MTDDRNRAGRGPATDASTRRALGEAAARAALEVPGVAFLRPGIADALRGAGRSREVRAGGGPPAGVGVNRKGRGGSWEIHVQVVVRRDRRALDVARAVETAVTAAARAAVPGALRAPGVKVTVAQTI